MYNRKPNCSYNCLIGMALKSSETGRLPVGEIYRFFEREFPYFLTAAEPWKNSLRHSLSLGHYFRKYNSDKLVTKKGHLWEVDPKRASELDKEMYMFLAKGLPENLPSSCHLSRLRMQMMQLLLDSIKNAPSTSFGNSAINSVTYETRRPVNGLIPTPQGHFADLLVFTPPPPPPPHGPSSSPAVAAQQQRSEVHYSSPAVAVGGAVGGVSGCDGGGGGGGGGGSSTSMVSPMVATSLGAVKYSPAAATYVPIIPPPHTPHPPPPKLPEAAKILCSNTELHTPFAAHHMGEQQQKQQQKQQQQQHQRLLPNQPFSRKDNCSVGGGSEKILLGGVSIGSGAGFDGTNSSSGINNKEAFSSQLNRSNQTTSPSNINNTSVDINFMTQYPTEPNQNSQWCTTSEHEDTTYPFIAPLTASTNISLAQLNSYNSSCHYSYNKSGPPRELKVKKYKNHLCSSCRGLDEAIRPVTCNWNAWWEAERVHCMMSSESYINYVECRCEESVKKVSEKTQQQHSAVCKILRPTSRESASFTKSGKTKSSSNPSTSLAVGKRLLSSMKKAHPLPLYHHHHQGRKKCRQKWLRRIKLEPKKKCPPHIGKSTTITQSGFLTRRSKVVDACCKTLKLIVTIPFRKLVTERQMKKYCTEGGKHRILEQQQ